jgi:hypothetical protein
LQGHPGTLTDCTVCHGIAPDAPGPHGIGPLKPKAYLPMILRNYR